MQEEMYELVEKEWKVLINEKLPPIILGGNLTLKLF